LHSNEVNRRLREW